MSTFYYYCENIQAENASRIHDLVYALLTSKVFMYQDGTTADSMKLIISQSDRYEEYTADNIDLDVLNALKSDSRPVSISISGYYDDYGSEILHSMRAFFENAGDDVFDNISYRLSYTEDGSAPRTFVARKEADGSVFRGMVEAQELAEIPAGDWEMTDYILEYYRDTRNGENMEELAPLMEKLANLSRDNCFNMSEFLNEDSYDVMFYDVPMSSNAQAEEYWKLWAEIDSTMKNGETYGLPMLIDRRSAKSMTVSYDGKPIYLVCQ